ncbi:MAG: GspE/PulE family protein [Acidobacteriota bacterium]
MQDLQKELAYRQKLASITNSIHAAPDQDSMLALAQDELVELLEAERVTIYASDLRRNQLTSVLKSGSDLKHITVPLSYHSVAGYSAMTNDVVNISNVYDDSVLTEAHPKLRFDRSWDEASGFRSKQMLCVPLAFEDRVLGVVQVVNTKDDEPFNEKDAEGAGEVARMLGIALFNKRRVERANKVNSPFAGLVDSGAITEDQLEKAVSLARTEEKSVASILMDRFHVSRQKIGSILSQFHGCTFFRYDGSQLIPDEVKSKLDYDLLHRQCMAPVGIRGNTATFVLPDPHDLVKVDRARALGLASGIDIWVGIPEDIRQYVDRSYGMDVDQEDKVATMVAELAAEPEPDEAPEKKPDFSALQGEDDNAIVRLANQIILKAWQLGASDIHVEPYGERRPTSIRMRVDGSCAKQLEVPSEARNAVVSRFKIMAGLDIAERRKPQDGKIRITSGASTLELRVAVIPTVGGQEDVVLRLLASSEPMPLADMGFSTRNLDAFNETLRSPYGIILCVGPTGSGKTTTLHSALAAINTEDRKIWTAEDPVEITQLGLRQVQVRPKIGFTFASAMRAFLRADPDVIMIGEMRDAETAQIGVEASLTGHLVFSTLHTNSAPETVVRLVDLGVDPFNFADAMLGILAQRLARTLCKSCKEPYSADAEEFAELARLYGTQDFAKLGLDIEGPRTLHGAKGCSDCGGKGYRGRTGLHEYMIGTDEVQALIQRKAPADDIEEAAKKDGMTTLFQDGIAKILSGVTDLHQVRSVCMR